MGLRPLFVLLSFFLCTASIAELEPAQTSALAVSEYISELDRLASAAKQLAHPEEVVG